MTDWIVVVSLAIQTMFLAVAVVIMGAITEELKQRNVILREMQKDKNQPNARPSVSPPSKTLFSDDYTPRPPSRKEPTDGTDDR